jgi:hypothetical protein
MCSYYKCSSWLLAGCSPFKKNVSASSKVDPEVEHKMCQHIEEWNAKKKISRAV